MSDIDEYRTRIEDAPVDAADALAAVGFLAALGGIVLPWLSAEGPVIDLNGELVDEMTGLQAPDVQLLLVVVVLCALGALALRITQDDRTLIAGPIAVAAVVVLGLAGLYVLEPILELTPGAVHDPAVSVGIGVYVALVGGLALLASAGLYIRNRD